MGSSLKQIPESLLTRLWKERASREESLRAANGRRFRVIYPGRVGTTAGPDFRDAVFEEEGVGLVRGDVEVHVRQRDWDAHGHAQDPRYNGVALHVVATMDSAYSTLCCGSRVPVVSLSPLLRGHFSPRRTRDLWPLLEARGYTRPDTAGELSVLLDRAGDDRFLGTSDALLAALTEDDPEQVLYATLMEALGYSQNREPFLMLADRVPYRLLKRAARGSAPGERLALIQRMLLKAAGFPPCTSEEKGGNQVRWHLFRVRPQNHPRRRIV